MSKNWDQRFLQLAAMVASWSKDPSTKVGAVIVRPNRTVASVGFNGFPRGMSDSPTLLNNREAKLSRTIHAELNAILNAEGPVRGFTLYCTHDPCDRCAVSIIQAGVVKVVSGPAPPHWHGSCYQADEYFCEAGVERVHSVILNS